MLKRPSFPFPSNFLKIISTNEANINKWTPVIFLPYYPKENTFASAQWKPLLLYRVVDTFEPAFDVYSGGVSFSAANQTVQ